MSNTKRMDQIKFIIKTYLRTGSYRNTAKTCQVSKNTVKRWIKHFNTEFEDLEVVLQWSDDRLQQFLHAENKIIQDKERQQIFDQKISDWIKELKKKGVTRHLLWQEYTTQYGSGAYKYSQFCDKLSKHLLHRKLTLNLTHIPGEVMQMDFAGQKMCWVDRHTGEIHDCEVFVAVMPFSQYTFAMALPSQKVEDFIQGINTALEYFGCRPKVLLCDNLKSYVTKADRYSPDFNQFSEQLAEHYEVELRATRIARPKDKASVESAVGICYKRIYAPLRNEIFYSIEQLNEAIRYQLDYHNAMDFQKKEGSRKSIFEEYERPHMRLLPSTLFKMKRIAKAKVQMNYHVHLSEKKIYFSVPYRYVGHQAVLRYTDEVVEIFIGHTRVCTHKISSSYLKYQTKEDHVPTNHKQYKESQGYDDQYFLQQAHKIGPNTAWLIGYVLNNQFHQSQAFKTCQGILALGRTYSVTRLENAATRCKEFKHGNLAVVKNILKKNLDQQACIKFLKIPNHDNIRGKDEFI